MAPTTKIIPPPVSKPPTQITQPLECTSSLFSIFSILSSSLPSSSFYHHHHLCKPFEYFGPAKWDGFLEPCPLFRYHSFPMSPKINTQIAKTISRIYDLYEILTGVLPCPIILIPPSSLSTMFTF